METQSPIAENVRWNLNELYSDITDPKIDADIKTLAEKAKHFAADYKGKLAEKLGAAITDYAEIDMLSNKVMVYLFLRQSTDVANAAIKAKVAEAQRILSSLVGEFLTFFE